VSADDFVITRVIDAPRSVVFKAWIDPTQLARWWGPHMISRTDCVLDVRRGGAYSIVMHGPNGEAYPCKGTFLEVAEPERLVMLMDCSGHSKEWHDQIRKNLGTHRARDESNPAGMLVQTVTFEDLGSKTRLTVRTQFESVSIRDAMLKMGMNDGWSQSLERLNQLVAKH